MSLVLPPMSLRSSCSRRPSSGRSHRRPSLPISSGKERTLALRLTSSEVKLLQSGPLGDRPAQVQDPDGVLAEHQLPEVAGLPEARTGQSGDAVGPHVHGAQAGHTGGGGGGGGGGGRGGGGRVKSLWWRAERGGEREDCPTHLGRRRTASGTSVKRLLESFRVVTLGGSLGQPLRKSSDSSSTLLLLTSSSRSSGSRSGAQSSVNMFLGGERRGDDEGALRDSSSSQAVARPSSRGNAVIRLKDRLSCRSEGQATAGSKVSRGPTQLRDTLSVLSERSDSSSTGSAASWLP
ncbi:hypothetical protein EYF80_032676 [Liparis tanakae]|uniref:Uncharacterized protein n=1 Tax=Liparis tanakae TaxID=230148 RepID=A0A4Z2GUQ3_9TELE|nr:hypothetical protein EYF80_032676 [Liparis tanakae]